MLKTCLQAHEVRKRCQPIRQAQKLVLRCLSRLTRMDLGLIFCGHVGSSFGARFAGVVGAFHSCEHRYDFSQICWRAPSYASANYTLQGGKDLTNNKTSDRKRYQYRLAAAVNEHGLFHFRLLASSSHGLWRLSAVYADLQGRECCGRCLRRAQSCGELHRNFPAMRSRRWAHSTHQQIRLTCALNKTARLSRWVARSGWSWPSAFLSISIARSRSCLATLYSPYGQP